MRNVYVLFGVLDLDFLSKSSVAIANIIVTYCMLLML